MVYSYFELIFGIILILLSIAAIITFFKSDKKDFIVIIPISFGIILGVLMFGDAFYPPTPTKEDVYNKKAKYIKTIQITGNDTIETYEIKWLDEFDK